MDTVKTITLPVPRTWLAIWYDRIRLRTWNVETVETATFQIVGASSAKTDS